MWTFKAKSGQSFTLALADRTLSFTFTGRRPLTFAFTFSFTRGRVARVRAFSLALTGDGTLALPLGNVHVTAGVGGAELPMRELHASSCHEQDCRRHQLVHARLLVVASKTALPMVQGSPIL